MEQAKSNIVNEQLSAEAFSRQSAVFDQIYCPDSIIQYKRGRVRSHVQQYLPANSNILELNAGTGEDATWFASQGHSVHATDISIGMLSQLAAKAQHKDLGHKISVEQCSYTALDQLKNKGPYDLIFSNFAGLNCTGELDKVLLSFASLLKSKGMITMAILPPFCLWETMLVFKGKFRTAFRRFNSSKGAKAHVEGVNFKCWYYKPSFVVDTLKNDFDLVAVEGLCTIVPPSYIEHFAEKHPRWYKLLTRTEDRWKASWPWKYIGDYYIITLRKK